MQAQVDIRSWIHKQNDWLQEAIDRLLKKRQLDGDDIAALVTLIKTPDGRKAVTVRATHLPDTVA